MTYKGHFATGLMMTVPVFAYLKVEPTISNLSLLFVATFWFSVFPDIDTPKSFIANRNIALKVFSFILSIFVKHRGITHSLFFVILVSAALYYISLNFLPEYEWLAVIGSVAYFSHLMADALTKEGIELFYPFSERRFHLLPKAIAFKTGGLGELFVTFIFAMAVYLEFHYFNLLS